MIVSYHLMQQILNHCHKKQSLFFKLKEKKKEKILLKLVNIHACNQIKIRYNTKPLHQEVVYYSINENLRVDKFNSSKLILGLITEKMGRRLLQEGHSSVQTEY